MRSGVAARRHAESAARRLRPLARTHGLVILLAVVVVVLCIVNQRPGHDWGDDFSLYIRQSKALVNGNVGEVVKTNRVTVDESSVHTFSPYEYPWGFPIMLAPFYAWKGLDYTLFKKLEALAFGGFLLLFFALVRRRTGDIGGLFLAVMIGCSIMYVQWTNYVLSEFPYLLFVAMSLWWLDRCRRNGWLDGDHRRPLLILGFLIGWSYCIRREALALVFALVLTHVAMLVARMVRQRSFDPLWQAKWRRLLVPYGAAAGFVVGMQLILPSVLYQSFPRRGLQQVKPNIIWFRDILAEQIALKDPGKPHLDFLGSAYIAKWMLGLFVAACIVGIVLRLLTAVEEDAALFGYMFGTATIVAALPFHEGRYLFSITPFMAYFAFQGFAEPVRWLARRERSDVRAALPRVAGCVFIALFALATVGDLYRVTKTRLDQGTYVLHGPEDDSAQEMFAAVLQYTRSDDILAFFRARAMNLYTNRQTLQLYDINQVRQRVDWYMRVKDPRNYSQAPLDRDQAATMGFTLVWENGEFELWKVPPRVVTPVS